MSNHYWCRRPAPAATRPGEADHPERRDIDRVYGKDVHWEAVLTCSEGDGCGGGQRPGGGFYISRGGALCGCGRRGCMEAYAGRAAMEALTPTAFRHLERLGENVRRALTQIVLKHDAPFSICGAASLFRIHPKKTTPTSFRDAAMTTQEKAIMRALSRHFLMRGILLPFGAAASLSTPMSDADIEIIAAAFDDFLEHSSPVGEGGM
jgi:hypothetical protein